MVSKLKFKRRTPQTRDTAGKVQKPSPRKSSRPASINDTTKFESSQSATDRSDGDAKMIKEIVESSWHSASSISEIKGPLFLSVCDLEELDDDEEEEAEEKELGEEARQRVLEFYKKAEPKAISYDPKSGKVAVGDVSLDVLSEQAFSVLWRTFRKAVP